MCLPFRKEPGAVYPQKEIVSTGGQGGIWFLEVPLTFGPGLVFHEDPEQETCSDGSGEVCGMSGRDSELKEGNGQ